MWSAFYPSSGRITYSRDVGIFESSTYFRVDVDADEAFDVKSRLVIVPDYKDKAELNREQFYDILLK